MNSMVKDYYKTFKNKSDDLEKHVYLRKIQETNENLFYLLLDQHLDELIPYIYTPTIGKVCQNFSYIYKHKKPNGVFISYSDYDNMDKVFVNDKFNDTEIIVVTDGSRVLGLGDLGIGGMGISIGKLSLYVACAGIPPRKTLPVILDIGTNNEELLNNPEYLGLRHKRIDRDRYDEFIDRFITVIKKRFPKILLQWEDFSIDNALRLLNRYKDNICCFNDDIQGTAAVVVGALLNAVKISKLPLSEQKIVIVGAGSAGIGISNLIVEAIVDFGANKETAKNNIFLVDKCGLLTDKTHALDFQVPFIKSTSELCNWKVDNTSNISLAETVINAKATVIIGVSAQANIFTKDIIDSMLQHCSRPIVFPLSNPNTKAEAHPHDILNWTNGKALVGTGSPFLPYSFGNTLRYIDQINNCYVFPGIGLGVRAVDSKRVTNRMFLVAAKTLANMSNVKYRSNDNLFPHFSDIKNISKNIAIAVASESVNSGLANIKDGSKENIIKLIDNYTHL